MRGQSKPNQFVKLLAKTTKHHGIELVYFNPKDVDMKQKKISGRVLVDNKWENKEVNIPLFIDLTEFSFKNKKLIKFLRENSHFTADKLDSKSIDSMKKIKEDGEFADLLIPSIEHSDLKGFFHFINKHQQIIMKPTNGRRGDDIYKLSKKGRKYVLSHGDISTDNISLSKRQLKNFISKKSRESKFIYQKYIESKTQFGDPFDCRIRLEKNGKGKWEVVINLIRIGSGQKVVSNVAKSGSVSKINKFLKANYGEKWKTIKSDIINVGKTLPYKLEEIFNIEVGSLGIDIGVDKHGKLYLFEANTSPGYGFGEGPIAEVRCDYYKCMLDKYANSNG